MKRLLVISSFLVLLLAACDSKTQSAPQKPEVVRDVSVVATHSAQLPDGVAAPGTVRAAQTSQLAAQVMGSVVSVNAHEGDNVKEGQVLVVVDSTQAAAGLERAQAGLSAAQSELRAATTERDLAQSTLKRYTTLYERKSVSPQEFDEVKARHSGAMARVDAAQDSASQAKAAVAQAQVSLSHTRVRAPFDGMITARMVDPGAMAMPGTPLLTIEGSGKYRAEVTLDESSLRYAQTGREVPVTLDAYPEQRIAGTVVQIVPSADPQSRTFLVKIELPRLPILRSGLSAKAVFARGVRDALVVPRNAVVDRGALKAVYVVGADKTASLRYVTIGAMDGEHLEVLSGLAPNEAVIAAPAGRELSGKRIEVQ